MKTMYLFTALLVVFMSATGYATEKPKMIISAGDEQLTSIQFESPAPTWIEITIKDDDGGTVYYKKSSKRTEQFKQQFDFSEFRNGKYYVSINYGNQSLNRELYISANKIGISPVKFLYEPYIKLENGKLNVSFLNVAQKKVYLNFYKDNKLVDKVYLGNEMSIQKRLDLNQLEEGEYEIVMSEWFKNHSTEVQL